MLVHLSLFRMFIRYVLHALICVCLSFICISVRREEIQHVKKIDMYCLLSREYAYHSCEWTGASVIGLLCMRRGKRFVRGDIFAVILWSCLCRCLSDCLWVGVCQSASVYFCWRMRVCRRGQTHWLQRETYRFRM